MKPEESGNPLPGWAEAITQEEYTEAIQLAARILFWTEKSIDQ